MKKARKRESETARRREKRLFYFSLVVRACILLCLSVSLSPYLSVPSAAQSGRKPPGSTQQQQEKPVARIETKEVIVPLTAYNADGALVSDLAPKDVLVLEDGEARQVSYIRHEPANVVLIIDSSNEIGTFKNGESQRKLKEPVELWKQQHYEILPRPTAREFADNLVSKLSPADQIAIIQYADKVNLMQDWTRDRQQALTALQSKFRVGLKASFYDALRLAAEKLEKCPTGRRVVVLISDGLDTNSKVNRRQAWTALEKARAAVFVVGWTEVVRTEIEFAAGWMGAHESTNTATAKRIAELRRHLAKLDGGAVHLRDLAETSGGEIWLPEGHDALVASNKDVVGEIGAQYSLAFLTENKPSLDNRREIQVFAARRGLYVRSRRSYYIGD